MKVLGQAGLVGDEANLPASTLIRAWAIDRPFMENESLLAGELFT
jgi:hypothetical protein